MEDEEVAGLGRRVVGVAERGAGVEAAQVGRGRTMQMKEVVHKRGTYHPCTRLDNRAVPIPQNQEFVITISS